MTHHQQMMQQHDVDADGPGPHGGPVTAPGAGIGTEPGVRVGPGTAVKRYYAKYAHFSGRASRSEYWWVALYQSLLFVAIMAWGIPALPTAGSSGNEGMLGMVGMLYSVVMLAHLLPNIAVAVRRIHDAGFSGWFYLLTFLPFFGALIILIICLLPPSSQGERFDRP